MYGSVMQFQGMRFQGVYRVIGTPVYPSKHLACAAMFPRSKDGNREDENADSSGIKLWHARLGHSNTDSIKELSRVGAVCGLDLNTQRSKKGACGSCVKGKQTKEILRTNNSRSDDRCAVIHTDVCGPMPVPSFSGARYYVSFIHECTGYTSIIPIVQKSEVLKHFIMYHAWIEKQFGCELKRVHSDNGGEYVALRSYLQEKGIEHTTSPPFSPNQNGIAERANRTIVECARTMLEHAPLPKTFWAEAVVHAAKIRNNFISPGNGRKTSYEVMCSRVPDVSYFRVFGCLGWRQIPKELRRKLDVKSKLGIVVGCLENRQFKLWIPSRKVAVLSRDFIVHEDRFPGGDQLLEWPDSAPPLVDEGNAKGKKRSVSAEIGVWPRAVSPPTGSTEKTVSEEMAEIPQHGLVVHVVVSPPLAVPPSGEQLEALTYYPEKLDVNSNDCEESEGADQSGQPRYPRRERRPPLPYSPQANVASAFAMMDATEVETSTVKQALAGEGAAFWRAAIESELKSLSQHDTWEVVDRPEGAKPLSTRFVFARKREEFGKVIRYKARLVVRGFLQGDVEQTFAPVVDFTTIRTSIAVAVKKRYIIQQMDVRTAFLHGEIDSDVYITAPDGLDLCESDKVLKLRRGLYGLKQAPRLCHDKWQSVMDMMGFDKFVSDECVYRRGTVWLLLYVDDIVVIGSEEKDVSHVKTELKTHLDVKDLGTLRSFLGVLFVRDEYGAWLSQMPYISQVLEKFGMSNCKPVTTPMCEGALKDMSNGDHSLSDKSSYQELLGCRLFIATRTRPDITPAVSILCRYTSKPNQVHCICLKRILRYLQGTKSFALRISAEEDDVLIAFCDADWAGDRVDRRSTTGVLLQLGQSTNIWKSVKQNTVALSTTEAEFVALSEGKKLVLWLRSLLLEYGCSQEGSTAVMEDNQGAIVWGTDGVRHAKHVAIRRNFVKENVDHGHIEIQYCSTQEMTADILTKPLGRIHFEEHRNGFGVFNMIPTNARGTRGGVDVILRNAHASTWDY